MKNFTLPDQNETPLEWNTLRGKYLVPQFINNPAIPCRHVDAELI